MTSPASPSADGTLLAVGGAREWPLCRSHERLRFSAAEHASTVVLDVSRGRALRLCQRISRLVSRPVRGVQFTKLLHLPSCHIPRAPRACDSVASVQMCARMGHGGPVIADIGLGNEGAIERGAVDGPTDGASAEAGHDALSSASASGGCGCRLAS